MSEVAIRVENLSKRYRIGTRQAGYATIRETVTDLAAAPLRRLRRLGQPTPPEETIWALEDVSFQVKRGEVLGIIGPNGAGKTTLLKVLSRITEPTEGCAQIHGRVGSLLEVGTGFHPELTGRENIYLNGAILGMKRAEIHTRFDEIVQFAGIEKFLDTPVKRYSSGMYVRLAFAVAAHLEPEILLVDEVLAVGDVKFQKKCLGKMGDVAKEGRTVLFVSHNMAAMKALCTRAILLDLGKVQLDDSADFTISRYLDEGASGQYVAPASKAGSPHISRIWFSDANGVAKELFRRDEPVVINAIVNNPHSDALELELAFFDRGGYKLWNFTHKYHDLPPITTYPQARVRITFFVPSIQLREIFVHAGLIVKGYHVIHYVDHITEGLRYVVEEPAQDTYQHLDTLFDCPVDFMVTSHD